MKPFEIMFASIRTEICGIDESAKIKENISDENIDELYQAAKLHDLAHIVASSLEKLGVLGDNEISKKLSKQQMLAVLRYERINYELGELCRILEENKIPFMPLKGSVLRAYYEQPWMRTSCDIDVLINESDIDSAVGKLSEKGYKIGEKASHDVSIFAPSDVHIELHYNLVEDVSIGNSKEILSDIWKNVTLKEGTRYHYVMPDELFYFYHIAHMAKHFENGGCGVRPFLDMWLLNHKFSPDKLRRDEMLSRGGLLKFARGCEELSEVWFSSAAYSDLTKCLEDYILRAGVYGNEKNRVVVNQANKGGKASYIFSRIFLPYDLIKFQYPVLQKHKWLTPIMEVRRWFNLLKKDKAKSKLRELKISNNVSDDNRNEAAEMLKKLGI